MKHFFILLSILLTPSLILFAQQPYGGCWHPDYIKTWSPEKDPDAKFNRASIPLKSRINYEFKANSNQYKDGQVAVCLTMNPMASLTPSQGANNFLGYNPTYWQYIDMLIWWGGSAGEGVILTPTAPVIDVCHQNGVKVLGNVFFPPTDYGGQLAWLTQFLTKENGKYIYAQKLYEIAKYYGFDGWFINQETARPTFDFDKWSEFVQQFSTLAQADPSTKHFQIQWYDGAATIENKETILQPIGSSMFLQYGAIFEENMNNQLNIIKTVANPETGGMYTENDSYSKYYYGIEQAQSGLTGNGIIFDRLFPVSGHKGSVNIFNPEENTWKIPLTNAGLFDVNGQGEKAYEVTKTIESNESRFWVSSFNSAGWPDVSDVKPRNDYWPGLSQAIEERSTITDKPFVTSFSTGKGKYRFINGEKRGTQDWYHRGMQNILPTWRWWVETSNGGEKTDITFATDYDDAYNFGTSFRVGGKLVQGADYLIRLYKTQISVASGDYLQLVFKGIDPSIMSMKISTLEDGGDNLSTFQFSSTTIVNGWYVANIDLSSLNGKTLSVVALNLQSATELNPLNLFLGQLLISPATQQAAPSVTNFKCENISNAFTDVSAQLRLVWDAPSGNEKSHYNIYLERNGTKTLVGQTRNEGFFIPRFMRSSPAENEIKVSIRTVNNQYEEGGEQTLTLQFPEVTAPTVKIKLGSTLATVNQEIWYAAQANNYPTSYSWILPSNCELVEQKNDSVKVRFTSPGIYSLAVDVSNSVGTTRATANDCVEVNDSKFSLLKNVSAKKAIDSFSGSLSPEDPIWIIDGVDVPMNVRNKWCVGGQKEHWAIIDLKALYNIYKFVIYDCGNKEDASGNIKNYRMLVSQDKETWVEVVNEKGRSENIKEDWCAPIPARYVKFIPYDDEAPITIRIWEVQVHGIVASLNFVDGGPKTIPNNSVSKIEVEYVMSEAWSPDASLSVTPISQGITISDVFWDKDNQKVTFNIDPQSAKGMVSVRLNLKSGMLNCFYDQELKIEDLSYTAVSPGKNIFVKATSNASTWSNWISMNKLTDGVIGGSSSGNYWGAVSYVVGHFATIRAEFEGTYEIGKAVIDYATSSSYKDLDRIEFYASQQEVTDLKDATYMGQFSGSAWINNAVASIPTVDRRLTLEGNLDAADGKYFYMAVYSNMANRFFRPTEITLYGKEKASTSVSTPKSESFVYVNSGKIIIYSKANTLVEIYSILGEKLFVTKMNSTIETINNLKPNQIYIVKMGGEVTKVKL